MSELKQRDGDQPLPERNDSRDIQSMVVADIWARRRVGISRYGTALQAHNGRDALRDLYEELVDAAMYIKQVMVERDQPIPGEVVKELRAQVQRKDDLIGELRKQLEVSNRMRDRLLAEKRGGAA